MFKESKGIRDIHSLYESIYITEFNIENQLVSLQETVGFNDLTEDDLIELTDLIESVEFASLTEEEKRNMLQKVQDKLAGSKRAGFLGQLERTRRKVFGTKKEKEQTKKFDDEHENVPGEGIKSKLKGKDAEDDKKEKELELVINNSKKGDSKKSESDSKSKSKNGNSTFLSLSGSKESEKKYGGEGTKTVYNKDGTKTTTTGHSDNIRPDGLGGTKASSEKGKNLLNPDKAKEQAAKKQKEASDDEKGANEWGPGGQPSASKQIDAYKKGRPSPASFKTNQRQTRELIKKQSKEVYPSVTKKDLNQFNRTKKYTANDGSQVERSTVFTKHYKTGKPLGVMTGSQRKAYDKAAAAYKAQPTTPKPEKVPAVDTKPDTYKTNIGAFLNNKKKGDVKDKSRHTKVTSVMDMESYDAKGDVLDEGAAAALRLGGMVAPKIPSALKAAAAGAATGASILGIKKKAEEGRPARRRKQTKTIDQVKADNETRKEKERAKSAHQRAVEKDLEDDLMGQMEYQQEFDRIKNSPEAKQFEADKIRKGREAFKKGTKQESYDAYDLVLDYIIETNQASSIEEANYIMMEMDQNTIHEIVQAQKKTLGEGLKTAVGLGMLALPYAMSQLEKRWNPVKKARDKYQDKKATEYEKKSGTTKEDGYFR